MLLHVCALEVIAILLIRLGLEVNLNFPPHTPPQEIIVGEGSHPPFITAAYSEFIQPCKDFGPRMSLSNIAHGNSSFHNHPKQGILST